jgi:predicted O-methyltransferase YrrM
MKVCIGLTTIFDRQKQCARTLRSLMKQTKTPDEVWVFVSSKPHLLDKGIQPYCLDPTLYEVTQLYKQIRVEWVENQGPYRKLLPLLKKYSDDRLIITCDDDVLYKQDFVEKAVFLYEEHQCCIGFLGTRMNNSFVYSDFEDAKGTRHRWNLPKGCAGIVYHRSWFNNPDIFQYKDFPTCDDLWFSAWRIAAGIDCYIAEESSMEQSLPSGGKGNLWTTYNETSNSDLLEKILHFFVYRKWLQTEISFFSKESQHLFQWNDYIQQKLLPEIQEEELEGNIWSKHHTKLPDIQLLSKQKNIVWLARQFKHAECVEVGFNAGFSALLFLISNPELQIQGLDLGEHAYAHRCAEILKKDFPGRVNVIFGDSQITMPTLPSNTFDMVHVDGGHSEEVATSDIQSAARILKPKGSLLLDDTNLGAVLKAIAKVPQFSETRLPYKCSGYRHSLYELMKVP